MIPPEQIAFDIDGVFADTMGLFLEIAGKDFGIDHLRYEDITHYYLEECLDIAPETIRAILGRILDGELRGVLQPIDGACEVLSVLAGEGPLLFVTARPELKPIEAWVNQVLPRSPHGVEVVATGSFEAKGEVLKSRGIQFFVEDFLDVCFALERDRISPIVFRQPWNRRPHPFPEVSGWSDIAGLMGLKLP